MYVVDAADKIAGRMAARIAKRLLKGDEIAIINAEKSVINGDPYYTLDLFKQKTQRGDAYHGPFYPKTADGMLRRIIRGMLPRRTARGKAAFRRLTVHIGVPANLEGTERKDIGAKRRGAGKNISLGILTQRLTGREYDG